MVRFYVLCFMFYVLGGLGCVAGALTCRAGPRMARILRMSVRWNVFEPRKTLKTRNRVDE